MKVIIFLALLGMSSSMISQTELYSEIKSTVSLFKEDSLIITISNTTDIYISEKIRFYIYKNKTIIESEEIYNSHISKPYLTTNRKKIPSNSIQSFVFKKPYQFNLNSKIYLRYYDLNWTGFLCSKNILSEFKTLSQNKRKKLILKYRRKHSLLTRVTYTIR